MLPRLTTGARVFVCLLISSGLCLLTVIFCLISQPSQSNFNFRPTRPDGISCDENHYLFEDSASGAQRRIKQLQAQQYDEYCLRRTGYHRWRVYAN